MQFSGAINYGAKFLLFYCSTILFVINNALQNEFDENVTLNFTVKEGVEVGFVIGSIQKRPGFQYHINERNLYFAFNPESGEIRTADLIDREALSTDRLVLVIVGESPTYFITVRITIEDVNDNAPRFNASFHNVSLSESSKTGVRIVLPSAIDRDSGENGRIANYRLISGNEDHRFRVVPGVKASGDNALLLELLKPLDREQQLLYILNISATDNGSPLSMTGYFVVFVNVQDANDNAPVFNQSTYSAVIEKSIAPGSPVLQVLATDNDLNENAWVTYNFVVDDDNRPSGSDGDVWTTVEQQFMIDANSGVISARKIVNCSRPNSCRNNLLNNKLSASKPAQNDSACLRVCVLKVEASDHGVPVQRAHALVHVQLKDENEFDPVIRFRLYPSGTEFANVNQSRPIGSVIAYITATDPDFGDNGHTTVAITSGNELGHFRLDSSELYSLIRLNSTLDRDEVESYNLTVSATDFGEPPRTSKKSLLIYVKDDNDRPLEFKRADYITEIDELVPTGSLVAIVSIKNQSKHTDVKYSIIDGNFYNSFRINPLSGMITVAKPLDFETLKHYNLIISAKSSSFDDVDLTKTTVSVDIRDNNDHAPLFPFDRYAVKIRENLPIGTEILLINATDKDTSKAGQVRYFLVNHRISVADNKYFAIDSVTGSFRVNNSIDYEKRNRFYVTVMATDLGSPPLSSTVEVEITIEDENDNSPQFYPLLYSANVLKSSTAGTVVTQVRAKDSDMGLNAVVKYVIYKAPIDIFDIDSDTGDLILRRSPFGRQMVEVLIGCHDLGGRSSLNNATVKVYFVDSFALLPKFNQSAYSYVLSENGNILLNHNAIGTVRAADPDMRFQITYSIDGDQEETFEIGPFSGELRVRKAIDREAVSVYNLTVTAVGKQGVWSAPLLIVIDDVNDNAPKFVNLLENEGYRAVEIRRSWSAGYSVFDAAASDLDDGVNAALIYRLESSSDLFSIDKHTGLIRLDKPGYMLITGLSVYNLTVTVADSGKPSLFSQIYLLIDVVDDLIDWTALPPLVEAYVTEDVALNKNILKIDKLNRTLQRSAQEFQFSINSFSDDLYFGIFPDGWLYVAKPLDFEATHFHEFKVRAEAVQMQNNEPHHHLFSLVNVRIYVSDVNDNLPVCGSQTFDLSVSENSEPFKFIGYVYATDLDSGINGRLRYSMEERLSDYFTLDGASGVVRAKKLFDREELVKTAGSNIFKSAFLVADGGNPSFSVQCNLNIEVSDVNDNAPIFTQRFYTATVFENQVGRNELLTVVASDTDSGMNSKISYSIIAGNDANHSFSINSDSGNLMITKALDRERLARYRLIIEARDAGYPSLSSTAVVLVNVADMNDNAPQFINFPSFLNISESTKLGSKLYHFEAIDEDEGANSRIKYSIISGNVNQTFELHSGSGLLVLIKQLDFETLSNYKLIVSVQDNGAKKLITSNSVFINIIDENDNPPEIVINNAVGVVAEDVPISTAIMTVQATDRDAGENGKVRFSIALQHPSEAFKLDPISGVIRTSANLDRELIDSYFIKVIAEDQAVNTSKRLRSEKSINILISDVNDNAPRFVSPSAAILPSGAPVGYKIAIIKAVDGDLGLNGSIGYRMIDGDMDLFSFGVDGTLYLKRSIFTNLEPFYRLTIEAFDRWNKSHLRRFSRNLLAYDRLSLATRQNFTIISIVPRSGMFGLSFFEKEKYRFEVPTASDAGYEIGRLQLKGNIAKAEYYITGITADSNHSVSVLPIALDRHTGSLILMQEFTAHRVHSAVLFDVFAMVPSLSIRGVASCKVEIEFVGVKNYGSTVAQHPSLLRFHVSEALPIGSFVGKVKQNELSNENVHFLLQNTSIPFALDSNSGALTVAAALDRESLDVFDIDVIVTNGYQLNLIVKVQIDVIDENDNAPSFEENAYRFRVLESALPGTFIGQLVANDGDLGQNGTVYYRIRRSRNSWPFTIDTYSGVLSLDGVLDCETQPYYKFVVESYDGGMPSKVSPVEVEVLVDDVNDNLPAFVVSFIETDVLENSAVGTVIANLSVIDADLDTNPVYSIIAGNALELFDVERNGSVVIKAELDREIQNLHLLTIRAFDQDSRFHKGMIFSTDMTLKIHVLDVNDCAPKFVSASTGIVVENSPVGSIVAVVEARDLDEGHNGVVEYMLDSMTEEGFSIDPVMGYVRVNGIIDREIRDLYNLTVWAYDRGLPSLKTASSLSLYVMDQNDNAPRFKTTFMEAVVDEDVLTGSEIMQIAALDDDIGINGAFEFWIEPSSDPLQQFVIEPNSGRLLVARPFSSDVNESRHQNLTVKVANFDRLHPPDTAYISITTRATNRNSPLFTSTTYFFQVVEQIDLQMLPAVIGKVQARDVDFGLNGKILYSILQGNTSVFQLDPVSGEIKVLLPVDREEIDRFEMIVMAADSGSAEVSRKSVDEKIGGVDLSNLAQNKFVRSS